jgi:hypothetical protein
MRRYLWKHHDEASHTLEQACLELDDATGTFTFTERRAYADWGDRLEETTVRRGSFTRNETELVCSSESTHGTKRRDDHEMGTSEQSEDASAETQNLAFRIAPDGGIVCPPGLALASGASGQTMRPSIEPLHTLFG